MQSGAEVSKQRTEIAALGRLLDRAGDFIASITSVLVATAANVLLSSKLRSLSRVDLTMLGIASGLAIILVVATFLSRLRTAERRARVRELKRSEKELFQSIEASTARLLGQ